MIFRSPSDVRVAFQAHAQRALLLTTVEHESHAVKAHLVETEILIGKKGALYEFGRFPDPAGDWLVVHAITQQGNSDAGLAAQKAYQEFGDFDVQMFVGVAGSLKDDIPIGSVVIGNYVYNGHSAKVGDSETFARPHGLAAAPELLNAARGLIHIGDWRTLIRASADTELPNTADYPCNFPPLAIIKGVVSGEEVVASDQSERYAWIRLHFNDCGAIDMEGWGVMNAGHHENAPSIIVRGISDMCVGKDHAKDKLHQPIAAAHAAAFAFSILSFRSKVRTTRSPAATSSIQGEVEEGDGKPVAVADSRVELVFNFQGDKDEWSKEKIEAVVNRLRVAVADEKLELIRVDIGSVRLVVSVRESSIQAIDIAKLREAASEVGVTLLGATLVAGLGEAESAKKALAEASADLLGWEKTLPNGVWMERPEQQSIQERMQLSSSTTVLLGEPGSGKSALLSKIASDLLHQGAAVFAIKADFISPEVANELDLKLDLQLPAMPSELVLRLSKLQPVYVIIDQLDALASQLDLRSGRLNVLLNLVRRIGDTPNIHVLLSARMFEFNHDVRLRAIEAESVALALPPWHEIKETLTEVGIDPDAWPEKARDVVRIPQALKTFISLASSGPSRPFETYQAMLEQLWNDRIASSTDSGNLIDLASDVAAKMAEEEVLWLAASRFDERLASLKRLEALGFIVRSENTLSIAFSHQTVFDYVLARTFVRDANLLSKYVLERQDSLFVRAKVWSALNYLRVAEFQSYEHAFLAIWGEVNLRSHLRLLLIEFLGQVVNPGDFEKMRMAEVLESSELRVFGLKAIAGGTEWFSHFSSSAIRKAMAGSETEAGQAARLLALNWRADSQLVSKLLRECWLPQSERDSNTWFVVQECPTWTSDVESMAAVVLKRTPIAIWHVEHVATALAVEQPEMALRLVRAKLDYLLAEARQITHPPLRVPAADEEENTWQVRHDATKPLSALLNGTEWNDLPTLADADPASFIKHLWPWYASVFSEILDRNGREAINYIYSGRYVLELESQPAADSPGRDKPVLSAIQIALEELAKRSPLAFAEWSKANSALDAMAAQQLAARGYAAAADQMATASLEWLLEDARRFQLGNAQGHRRDSTELVRAAVPYWSTNEVEHLEQAVLNYRPNPPEHVRKPEQRKVFSDLIRATKKELLQAIGMERLTPTIRELVATEERALGDRFERSFSEVEGGWIGSPMDALAMAKAKDRDILRIFREISDKAGWDHPTDWMRGGNIQLSRAFAEFSRTDPKRAIRLMEQFEPLQQERGAGYALDAMAEDTANDTQVLDAVFDLHMRNFGSEEFRSSAARAIAKIASRRDDLDDAVIELLVGWLREGEVAPEESEVESIEETANSESKGSILWGHGGITVLPGGNFISLSALASILMGRGEQGRNQFIGILEEHLTRERNVLLWKALLRTLNNAGGSTPREVSEFVKRLFDSVPGLVTRPETVHFLAHAQRWDDELVLGLIENWPKSELTFLQQAYGELVGLVSTVKSKKAWENARESIISSGSDEMRVGLAHAAVNLWREAKFRQSSGDTLDLLLRDPSTEVIDAVMDVFRLVDELAADASTRQLLNAIARPQIDLSRTSSHFVVERLQDLLPHETELVAEIALKLVNAWRNKLGDFSAGTSATAPQLTDLALTLHRLGGPSRSAGVTIFEAMIEIDAYGARETLSEIDGRFDRSSAPSRQRLSRRRRARGKRRGAA
jgi:nucleoside phosphorylase